MNWEEFQEAIRKADQQYRGFPDFTIWSELEFDRDKWERNAQLLNEDSLPNGELREKAYEISTRFAAIDTGALERLYETDRGSTYSIATQTGEWERETEKKGEEFKPFLESQLRGYALARDFSVDTPLNAAWIRQLHTEICRPQKTYKVRTQNGLQEHELPLGEYKKYSNHVEKPNGTLLPFCPVSRTAQEMKRLIEELQSETFRLAHPVVQASFIHYGITVVHPFADGNGRVARALASVFAYRALQVPVLILAEERDDYLQSLELADNGNFGAFAEFILERIIDGVRTAYEWLRTQETPSIQQLTEEVSNLYKTRGGYSHPHVDDAGYRLLGLVLQELGAKLSAIQQVENQLSFNLGQCDARSDTEDELRLPIAPGDNAISVRIQTNAPAAATIERLLRVEVPRDSDKHDDVVIRCLKRPQVFTARISELIPKETSALKNRVQLFVQRLLQIDLNDLLPPAKKDLGKRGY